MAKDALSQLASPKHLACVWRDMYRTASPSGRKSAGYDAVSLDFFEKHSQAFIKELSGELKRGEYTPQPLTPHFIPKPNGKDRVICVPAVRDRLLQRALIQILENRGYTFNNSISYGFVKGRSVKQAAKQAKQLRNKYPWAYKADIASFFDKIDRNLLINKVKNNIRLRSLHPLLVKIINTEIRVAGENHRKRINKLGIVRGVGLRQGMPISPYLANLMLKSFDDALIKKNINAVRYADDLVAFGRSRPEMEEFHSVCTLLIEKENLTIHALNINDKTTIATPEETIEFLGLGLSPSPSGYTLLVTENQLTSIGGKLMIMTNIEHCVRQGITLSKFLNKLEGKIQGYRGAYDLCENLEKLEHFLHSKKIMVISKTLEHIGIDYRKLPPRKRRFLEID